jgi:hypothetical protein
LKIHNANSFFFSDLDLREKNYFHVCSSRFYRQQAHAAWEKNLIGEDLIKCAFLSCCESRHSFLRRTIKSNMTKTTTTIRSILQLLSHSCLLLAYLTAAAFLTFQILSLGWTRLLIKQTVNIIVEQSLTPEDRIDIDGIVTPTVVILLIIICT